MNDIQNGKLVIVIDQKKDRVRIHKYTLHKLGDPKFIQLLVNPENLTLAILPAGRMDSCTHRIVLKNFISKQSYELYSRFLIQALQKICTEWKPGESYKLCGEMIPDEKIVTFDLRNVQLCAEYLEVQDD